ncbi:hypothetical protein B0H11DRAFT_1692069, partial [Mycena galericulata]
RSSADSACNTRGSWLLETCQDARMSIINGSQYDINTHAHYTSFQPMGSSVIDFAMVSNSALPEMENMRFAVNDFGHEWSDHAAISMYI